MASPRTHVNVLTPRVRITEISQRALASSDGEESADDSSFHARHAVLEKAERKANKSVYCTAQYRQAVDRARQRQKEEEKARDRLLPGSGPAPSPRAEEIDDSQAIETEAAKRNTGSRKRSRSGRGSVDAERDAKRAQVCTSIPIHPCIQFSVSVTSFGCKTRVCARCSALAARAMQTVSVPTEHNVSRRARGCTAGYGGITSRA